MLQIDSSKNTNFRAQGAECGINHRLNKLRPGWI